MNKQQFLELIKDFDNIIFDYGGVLIDIDYNNTIQQLSELSPYKNTADYYSKSNQTDLFSKFEIGKISQDDFLSELCILLKIPPHKKTEVHHAWCGMLMDLKEERLELLNEINKTKRIFILSNINIIHENFMVEYIKNNPQFSGFYDLFEKVYFSHHLGLRKPNKDIFEFVLDDAGLKMHKTLFIDDSEQHILSATELGLATHLLTPNTLMR